jgi:glycosidase
MEAQRQYYPKAVLNSLMNILGTHDTMRILTILSSVDMHYSKDEMAKLHLTAEQRAKSKKLLRLASLLQYTLPGVPCIYYGDEAGMEGGADPFNRVCYPWGSEDGELIDWYRSLARLRQRHGCFKDGKYELVQACGGLFAFTRGEGADRVLVAVNVSHDDAALKTNEFHYDLLAGKETADLTVKAGEPAVFATRKG